MRTTIPVTTSPPALRTTTDQEVRARFRNGDPEAVHAVYREHGRVVYAVAYKVLGDKRLAEEAAQDAFLNAWRAATSFDNERELRPWLAVIARRAAIDVYRREAARATDPLHTVPAGARALSIEPPAPALHDAWEVRDAVEQLPDDEREIVRLHHYEDLTYAEIAQRLRVPLGTVKSRSFRAYNRLATLLRHLHNTSKHTPDTVRA